MNKHNIVMEDDFGQSRAVSVRSLYTGEYSITRSAKTGGGGATNDTANILGKILAYPTGLSDALSSMANMYRHKAELIANFVSRCADRPVTRATDVDTERLLIPMWDTTENKYQLAALASESVEQLTDKGQAVIQVVDATTGAIKDKADVVFDDIVNAIADQTSQLRTNEAMFEYFASHSPTAAFNVSELAAYAKSYTGVDVDPNSVVLQATSGCATVIEAVNAALQARIFDDEEYVEGELPVFDDAAYTGANAFGLAFTRIWDGITQWFANIKFDITKIGEFFKQVGNAIGNALKWIVGKIFPNLTSDYETHEDPVNHLLEVPIFTFSCEMGTEETNIFTKYSGNKWVNNAQMYFPTPGSCPGTFHSHIPDCLYCAPARVTHEGDTKTLPAGFPVFGPMPHYMHNGSYQWNMMEFIEWCEDNIGKIFTTVLPNLTLVTKIDNSQWGGVRLECQVYLRTNPLNIEHRWVSRFGDSDDAPAPYFEHPEFSDDSNGRYRMYDGVSQKPKPVPSIDNSDNAAIAGWIIANVVGATAYGDSITQQMCMFPTVPLVDPDSHMALHAGNHDFTTLVQRCIFGFGTDYNQTLNSPNDLIKAIRHPASRPFAFSMCRGDNGEMDIKFGGVVQLAAWNPTTNEAYFEPGDGTRPMFYTTNETTLFAMSMISALMRTRISDNYQTRIYFPTVEFVPKDQTVVWGDYTSWTGAPGPADTARECIKMEYEGYTLEGIYTPYYEGTPGDYQIHPQTDMERVEEVYSTLKTIAGAVLAVAAAVTIFKVRKAFRKKKLAKSAQFDQAKLDFAAGNISIDDLYRSQKSAKRWGALSDAVAATSGSELKTLAESISPVPGEVTHDLNTRAANTSNVLTPLLDEHTEQLDDLSSQSAGLVQQVDTVQTTVDRVEKETVASLAVITGDTALTIATLLKMRDREKRLSLGKNVNGNW